MTMWELLSGSCLYHLSTVCTLYSLQMSQSNRARNLKVGLKLLARLLPELFSTQSYYSLLPWLIIVIIIIQFLRIIIETTFFKWLNYYITYANNSCEVV